MTLLRCLTEARVRESGRGGWRVDSTPPAVARSSRRRSENDFPGVSVRRDACACRRVSLAGRRRQAIVTQSSDQRIARHRASDMLNFVGRRLVLIIPSLLGVAVLIFLMLRVLPGDIVEVKLRGDGAAVTAETIQLERTRLGLDQPQHVQFLNWIGRAVTGDLGHSMWTGKPVTEIGLRIGLSIQVSVHGGACRHADRIAPRYVVGRFSGTAIDYEVRLLTVSGLAIPSFSFGMMIILLLLYFFNWAPPITYTPFWRDPVANMSQLFWPALAVGYRYAAVAARVGAIVTPGGSAGRLYPPGPGQGRLGAFNRAPPRDAQWPFADRYGGGPGVRLPHRGARGHRTGI